MKKWIFWAGIGIFIGGIVSFSMGAAVEETLSFQENISGYAIGWMGAGAVLMAFGLISGRKKVS